MYYNFGVEGESYELKDGYPTFTDLILNNPDGLSATQALSKYTHCSYGRHVPDGRKILLNSSINTTSKK